MESTEELHNSESPNFINIDITKVGYQSLEEFVESLQIDTEAWEIYKHEITSWTTPMKDQDDRPIGVMNHRVNAHLKRREMVEIMPPLQPVQIKSNLPKHPKKPKALRDLKTALILPDPQFGFERDLRTNALLPFHDRLAMDIAVQMVRNVQPDVIVFLGDLMDFADMSSKFIKKPGFYFVTQPALIECAWWLAQVRKEAPTADIYVIEGNHDKRLETAFLERLMAAYDLRPVDEMDLPPAMSVPRLLALHDLNIKYVGDYPNGQVWLNDHIVCEHGATVGGGSGATVQKVVNKRDVSVIHGHIHRREWAARTIHERYGSRIIEAFSPGCLCDVTGNVPGRQKAQNWQQGLAVVYYTDYLPPQIIPVSIDKGVAIFNGGMVKGRKRIGQIKRETGWAF